MAVGGVTTVAGLVITAIPDDCEDKFICFKNSEIGAAIAVTGLIIFAIGAIQSGIQSEPPRPPPAIVNTAPPAPFAVTTAPPGFDEDGNPISVAPSNVPPSKPLPAYELDYTSPGEKQMAVQASAAARRGDCGSARASAKQLSVETRQKLAIVDEDFARCDR